MASPNRLIHETSAYLLQHARNPVDWYSWGPEAFARARAEDRPILLSIGYSSCHWCHVMERESFEDPGIAALMNKWFVSVKVDREERPDVDDVYMKAVQLLIGRGGWPLTAFLTPEGHPFHGGTYFPPVDRHGLPGFPRVLAAVAQAYRERKDEVARAVEQLRQGVSGVDAIPAHDGAALDPALPARAAAALARHVDHDHGGLGGAPKFPHAPVFQLFLRQHRAGGDADLLRAVLRACDGMANGGMRDQIGGGFHRYSVDAHWLVPHFEKMLYDNALLPRLYLDAYQVTRSPQYREVVTSTLDYLLREMQQPEGGFSASTDADSEGVEGRFFVWTRAEVAQVVAVRDVDLVCRFWNITDGGNFEGASIPHVTHDLDTTARTSGQSVAEVTRAIAAAREALYAHRSRRVPPALDDKVITAWNALVIGTLAEAGRVLGCARYVEAGERAAEFVWTTLRPDDRLLHVWAKGIAKHDAFLDDHAFLASAFLDLYEATGTRTHLERAGALAQALDTHFHDDRDGAFFFTPHDGEQLLARPKPGADGALPSGNGVAAHVFARLHGFTGEERYARRTEELLNYFHRAAAENPFGYVSWLEALERWSAGATEIVVVGARDDARTAALWAIVGETFVPRRLLVHADPLDRDPLAPARDRPMVGDRPTAYVCRGFTCAAPVTTPAELQALLQERAPTA